MAAFRLLRELKGVSSSVSFKKSIFLLLLQSLELLSENILAKFQNIAD